MKLRELTAWMMLVLSLLFGIWAVTHIPEPRKVVMEIPCPEVGRAVTSTTTDLSGGSITRIAKKNKPTIIPPAEDSTDGVADSIFDIGIPAGELFHGYYSDSILDITSTTFHSNCWVDSIGISYKLKRTFTTTTITKERRIPETGIFLTGSISPSPDKTGLGAGLMRVRNRAMYGLEYDIPLNQFRIVAGLKIN